MEVRKYEKKQKLFWLHRDLCDLIKAEAEKSNSTMTDVVERALSEFFERKFKEELAL